MAEEVLQILLEILVDAIDKGHGKWVLQTGSRQPNGNAGQEEPTQRDIMEVLLDLSTSSNAHWVRICALAVIESLATALPEQTLEKILKVPSALELLMNAIDDPVKDVRNQALILLLRLSPHEQVKLFITFDDGFQNLIRIAQSESPTTVSTDALSIVFNSLKGNIPGQRQFCESPLCLAGLVSLMDLAAPATASVAVDCVRLLCRGSLPVPIAANLSPKEVFFGASCFSGPRF